MTNHKTIAELKVLDATEKLRRSEAAKKGWVTRKKMEAQNMAAMISMRYVCWCSPQDRFGRR